MKIETERGYLMTNDDKIKTNKELAKEIVNAWNKNLMMKHRKNLKID